MIPLAIVLDSTLVIIAIIVLGIIIWMYAQKHSDEPTIDKYTNAVKDLSVDSAEFIGTSIKRLTESEEKKRIRLAEENIAKHNSYLFYEKTYEPGCLNRLLHIDDSFRNSLDLIGLSEDQWSIIGRKLFYIGVIKKLSRDSSNYAKQNASSTRKAIIEEWPNHFYPETKSSANYLIEALAYFDILQNEWIQYGDVVLDMYSICDSPDLQKFGYYSKMSSGTNIEAL